MEPIWVEYERTVEDAVATTAHGFYRGSAARMNRVVVLGAILLPGLVFTALAALEWANGANPADLVWYLIPVALSVGVLVWPYLRGTQSSIGFDARASFRQHFSKPENRWQFGRCAAGVTDGGFVLVNPVSETRYLWHGIEDVTADHEAMGVWVGGMPMGSVPRRAFADEEAYHRFVDAARQKVAEAKPTQG